MKNKKVNPKNNYSNKERIFAVTGAKGRLGSALVSMGYLPIDVDITRPKEVKEVLGDINPDVLVNCASFTDVDACEVNNLLKISQVNGLAVGLIRECFAGRLIHISTDYIFDGKSGPYLENSIPNPINQYGISKLLGEELLREYNYHLDTIIRTTILYGSKVKPDFVSKVLSELKKGNEVELPVTIKGTPTYIPHLALAIHHIAKMVAPPKIVNIAGKQLFSRYEFGLVIANTFGYNPELVIPTRRAIGIANRPRNAGLKVSYADKLGIPIFDVVDGLKDLKERMNETQS